LSLLKGLNGFTTEYGKTGRIKPKVFPHKKQTNTKNAKNRDSSAGQHVRHFTIGDINLAALVPA
jgi:hypothetical protein